MQMALVQWPYSGRGCARWADLRLDVMQRLLGRLRQRRIVETTAALQRVLASRAFERRERLVERVGDRRGQRLEVEVAHAVVGGVMQGADEPRVGRDVDAARAHAFAHVGAIGHLGEEPRVGAAATPAARAAVVRGLVRVVEARRAVSQDDDNRREVPDEADDW